MRQLRGEDQDRQCVDEAGAHRTADKTHQHAQPQQAEHDLEQAGQHAGRQQVGQAVRGHQRRGHQRHRAGGGRDHRRAAAAEGDDDPDDEGREQADLRIDTGHRGEGDDLGNQRESGDGTGHQLAQGRGTPLGQFVAEKGHGGTYGGNRRAPPRRQDAGATGKRTWGGVFSHATARRGHAGSGGP